MGFYLNKNFIIIFEAEAYLSKSNDQNGSIRSQTGQ